MPGIQRRLRALAIRGGDRRGSVAIIVALMVVALIGMLALAVDVSAAVSAHTRLREAADVAALTAVRQAAVLTASNSNADLTAAQAAGLQRFTAQASSTPSVKVNNVSVQVVRDGLTITSSVTFDATYATQIAGILNGISPQMTSFASLPLIGRVGAKQQVGAFINVHVLMDTSNSMTIAADKANAAKLATTMDSYPMWQRIWNGPPCTFDGWASNPDGGWFSAQWYGPSVQPPCTFACHATLHDACVRVADINDVNKRPTTVPSDGTPIDPYTLAHAAGVVLRVDLLKTAVSQIATALDTSQQKLKFQFGFYTFATGLTQAYALGMPGGALGAVSGTEVTPFDYPPPPPHVFQNPAQTNVGASFDQFTGYVGASGDGSSQDAAKQIAIILTDGVEDWNDGDTRNTAAFNPVHCDKLKAPVANGGKNATVFVLQAASLDNFVGMPGGDPQTLFDASVAAMKACASDASHYFLASSSKDIQAATQAIISLTLSQPTLITQGNTSLTQQ